MLRLHTIQEKLVVERSLLGSNLGLVPPHIDSSQSSYGT
jgi:hypothetical protein